MTEHSEIAGIIRSGDFKPEPPARFWKQYRFWIIVILFAIAVLLHYPQQLIGISQSSLFTFLGTARFSAERVFFLIPVSYASFVFGLRGGATALVLALAVMLPRLIWMTTAQPDAFLETGFIIALGLLMALWLESMRREQKRRENSVEALQITRQEVQQYLQALENSQKALETVNAIGLVVSQSLDLQMVLETTAERVREVMDLDVSLVFLANKQTGELELRAWRGVSEEFVAGLKGLKIGEGFNGRVAASGQPLVVANPAGDSRLTREVVKQEGIFTQLIVPLKSREQVVGTLTVAERYARSFSEDEIDLLTAIGRQVGIAIENSRLYQQERAFAGEQKDMQEKLRFYLQQVTRAQEEERKRIAQELHDDTIQNMVLLMRQIDRFATSAGYLTPQQSLFLEELRQRISTVSDEVRRFTQDLRPSILDDLGLLPTLEWLAADVTKNFDIAVVASTTGEPRRFSPDTELNLFRIAQEALRNVWKHSHATMAQIKVDFKPGKMTMTVSDNGRGFEVVNQVDELTRSGKLGLVGMQERAQLIGAKTTVKSVPGKGTTVAVELLDLLR